MSSSEGASTAMCRRTWRVWATGFGGSSSLDGDGGTSNLDTQTGGVAAGLDYRLDPTALVGIAGGYQRFQVLGRSTADQRNRARRPCGPLWSEVVWVGLSGGRRRIRPFQQRHPIGSSIGSWTSGPGEVSLARRSAGTLKQAGSSPSAPPMSRRSLASKRPISGAMASPSTAVELMAETECWA